MKKYFVIIEQLWLELQNMQAVEENVFPRLEGGYSLQCKWSDTLYDIAGVEDCLD